MLTAAWREHRKLRYLVAGAWNTAFGYSAYMALYLLLQRQLHYLVIGVIAHVIATVNAFICQRQLVFRSRAAWFPAFLRFNIVQIAALCWGLAVLALTVEVLHFHPLFGQLAVMSSAVVGSYFLNRDYSFRDLGK